MSMPISALRRCSIGLFLYAALAVPPAVLGAAPVQAQAPAAPADVVLRGGAVYTVDAARSWARAVAVRDGRVTYVGSDAGVEPWIGAHTRVVELGGRLLLPAFQDAHVHPATSGVELGQCDLSGLEGAAAIAAKVRACAAEQPGDGWLIGAGWELPAFPRGAPTRQQLDELVPDRPAYLEAADGHSAWLNTRGLERVGLTRETPDPPGGRLEREPDGTPAGTLRESAASLAEAQLPKPALEERVAGVVRAQERLHRVGVTAVLEANAGRAQIEAYRAAERAGKLALRVTVALGTDPERGDEQVDGLVAQRREFAGRLVRPTTAKIFADGVIEARTAAMLAPYLDTGGAGGELLWDAGRLTGFVTRLVRADFDVHVHAIGDRAVRETLDAFEAARALPAARPPRLSIAHLQVIDPADQPRFRRLGVRAVFQPLWAFADRYVTDLTWPALGPERSRTMYPMASLHREGAPLAFGSDWSVSSPAPLEGIQVAVTRLPPDAGRPGEVMQPEERLSLPEALAAYTIGAAAVVGLEGETGSIEVGKRADLIVLSRDVFAVPPREIARTRVFLTLFEGRPVYRDPSFPW